jgi:hypothetical protein
VCCVSTVLIIIRLLLDVQSLNDRIGSVAGAGDIGEYLLKLVNDKTILRPPSPELAPAPAPAPLDTDGAVTNGTESGGSPKGEQKGPEMPPGSLEKEDAQPPTVAKSKKESMEKN